MEYSLYMYVCFIIVSLYARIKIDPVWFSGHRVYEFPVRVKRTEIMGKGLYECQIREDGDYECIVGFDPDKTVIGK